MSKRGMILGIGLLVLIAGTVAVLGWWSREPSYHGRTLRSWLQQDYDTPLSETQKLSEAQAAVRAIGAEAAVPYLLKLAEAQDGPIRSWVIKKQQRWDLGGLMLREAEDTQQLAVAGFEVLGTNCALAVPDLSRLLDDTNHAFTAIRCLTAIGKPAEFAIWSSLTNRDSHVRQAGITALAGVTDHADEFIARLKSSLNDPDSGVRGGAVRAIGSQIEAPDSAIPLLLAALDGKDEYVALSAAGLLAGFGTNGLRAFSALTNAVERRSPAIASQALRTLLRLAPQEALPLALGSLRSPDAQRRRGAVARLRAYPVTTPEIRDALEGAAADPDPQVARLAQESIARLNQGGPQDGRLN
jgi:HEAT repeat protein